MGDSKVRDWESNRAAEVSGEGHMVTHRRRVCGNKTEGKRNPISRSTCLTERLENTYTSHKVGS